MNQLRVNRKYFVSLDNIEKFVIKKNEVWVYQKKGYPKIYKCLENIDVLKNRLVNLGKTIQNFKLEYENDTRKII